MKRVSIFLGALALMLIASYLMVSAQNEFKTLDDIRVVGNNVTVILSGETQYNAFKISNPPKIVIEFTNTEHNWNQKELLVNQAPIKRVRSAQFENEPVKIARVVIDLTDMVEYEIKHVGAIVTLTLQPGKATAMAPPAAAAAPVEAPKNTSVPTPEKKIAQAEKPPVYSALPKRAAPVAAAPAVAAPEKKVKKQSKKHDRKQSVEEEKPKEDVVIPQTPVTLDFEAADIKDVLRILAVKSGINIIYGEDVKGEVTLRLENVPFHKAFETILSLNGLVSQVQGPNILRVATPMKIAEERTQAVTFTKIFPLNYAKATDVKSNLDSVRSAEGRKGSISVDERTNSLIVTDTPEGLVSIEKLIGDLDKKPKQVLIEARIVEINLTEGFDMGIQWQYAGTLSNANGSRVDLGRSDTLPDTTIMGLDGTGVGQKEIKTIAEGGTGVAFPAAPAAGQAATIAFGIVSNNNSLTGFLTTLQQKGLSKILSNPRVTTINNQEAKILVGQKIPFTSAKTISSVGSTTSTEFLDVGIKLTVTPTINVDNRITLNVHPEVSLFVRADPSGPVLGTREAQTTVLVANGETVVIGGLITEEDRKLGTQVPLLGDLPVIGHLFRRDYKTKERTELLVFITPKIID